MSPPVRWFGALAVLLLIAAGGALFLSNTAGGARQGQAIEGPCIPVSGIGGPRDIEIDARARRAFISSFNADSGEGRGAIYYFSLEDPMGDAWDDRTGGAPARFDPVGMSLFDDGTTRRLFVVNAAAGSVELYEVEAAGDLGYLETFRERRLASPSNVTAVGPRSFYVVGEGGLMHFDGVAWRVVAEGLGAIGGLAASPDGARIYVSETTAGALRIFDRDRNTGNLTKARTVKLRAAPHNITVDGNGALTISARPKSFPIGRGAGAMSLVLGYDDRDPSIKPRALFVGDGGFLDKASVAARLDRTLLVGGPSKETFLLCELPAQND